MAEQGSTSCPWKHSTISKYPTVSFSQPSLSPESPTAPRSRLGRSTFGARDDYRTELIDFDVAHIRLPYNAILEYPALAKFMAVTDHGYNVLKMPGSGGIITIPCEERDAVCSLERAFQAAAINDPDSRNEGPPEAIPKKKQPRRAGPQEDGVAAGASSGPAPAPRAPPSIA